MLRRFLFGFTLTELLVVIAVVAVLSAILLPVFASARERAQAGRCLSNQRQIGSAMMLYVDEWDGTYPSGWFGMPGSSNAYDWKYALLPLLGSTEVFRCPSNPVGGKEFDQTSGPGVRLSISYAPNRSAIPRWGLDGERVTRESDVPEPAGTIMLVENRSRWVDQGVWAVSQHGDEIFPPEGYSQPETMGPFHTHRGLVNIVFMDGHAKPTKLASTLVPREMWRDYLRDPETIYNQEWCRRAAALIAEEYR